MAVKCFPPNPFYDDRRPKSVCLQPKSSDLGVKKYTLKFGETKLPDAQGDGFIRNWYRNMRFCSPKVRIWDSKITRKRSAAWSLYALSAAEFPDGKVPDLKLMAPAPPIAISPSTHK